MSMGCEVEGFHFYLFMHTNLQCFKKMQKMNISCFCVLISCCYFSKAQILNNKCWFKELVNICGKHSWKNTEVRVKGIFFFLMKHFSLIQTCQWLVTVTLTGTWESRGNSSLFHNEEWFVFNNNEKILVITVKRPRKVVHSQVDEIFL